MGNVDNRVAKGCRAETREWLHAAANWVKGSCFFQIFHFLDQIQSGTERGATRVQLCWAPCVPEDLVAPDQSWPRTCAEPCVWLYATRLVLVWGLLKVSLFRGTLG